MRHHWAPHAHGLIGKEKIEIIIGRGLMMAQNCPHQEVGSFFPPPWIWAVPVTTLTKRMQWKRFYVSP